ncbi:MAG: S24 family peptidase [Alistipes sp.]
MREKQNNWQRLEEVIRKADMTTNYFARYIGLSRGENLYQIKRGNYGISRDLAQRIVARFPDINLLWLLTGEGQMSDSNELRGAQIPFFRTDVEHDLSRIDEMQAEGEWMVPMVADSDFAMLYMGQAMSPRIPAGSVVFLKKVDVATIILGGEYAIISRKIITLRNVRATEFADQWRLTACNQELFDDIFLKKEEIESAYKVCGILIIN